jgi:peptidoglycan-associated lipoprotein
MKATKALSVTMFAGLGALEGGCAHQDASPPVESAPYHSPVVATITSAQANLASQLLVSDEIARACQLHFGDADQAPKFSFDNSDVGDQDSAVLDQIATCVTSGPLQGRGLVLVGRADPRGEREYNMALGQRRARRLPHGRIPRVQTTLPSSRAPSCSSAAASRRCEVLRADDTRRACVPQFIGGLVTVVMTRGRAP